MMNHVPLLIVEDEEAIRTPLVMFLEEAGYDVRSAACLGEARAAIAVRMPELLVLDMTLGAESGESMLIELSAVEKAPATFVVSASPGATAIAARYGVMHVWKPFDLDHLIAMLADPKRHSRPRAL